MNLLDNLVIKHVLAATPKSNTINNPDNIPGITVTDPNNVNITDIVSNIINVFLWVVGIIAFIYIVYSGILYITAAGDDAKAQKGQKGLLWGIIGIVIVVAASVIIRAAIDLGNRIG